ncbi:MAG TPA: methylmalonyl Co-A mutase-associated GTPase MeaB [Roseiflexaceae bacterium]|jgi:LAO/AO transport system kinase|nr:methylmalonyl Co-A mutase-associated GTPase MeaB [Roseiflexaceae bacterium]
MPLDTPSEIAQHLLAGNRRALARAITRVETGGPAAQALMSAIYTHTGRAHVVGVTGAPGAGKSTLVNALALHWRQTGHTVGIVAVDPTSPFTGGAILGDRIRMQPLGGDAGVFVRSMANRGRLGGIARATGDAVALLDAAGFDIVVVETVGAGQSEVEIAGTAHTTVVIEVPGMGDDVQSIKAGILEIADVFVVNKADREGADTLARQLRQMLDIGGPQPDGWRVPIVRAVATRAEGVVKVAEAIDKHRAHLQSTGGWQQRAHARAAREFESIVQEAALRQIRERLAGAQWDELVERVAQRDIDPYTAAAAVLRS